MTRKLVFALSLVAAIAVVAGCKEDKPTPMNFDAKDAYKQSQDKYKQGAGAGTATSTTPKE